MPIPPNRLRLKQSLLRGFVQQVNPHGDPAEHRYHNPKINEVRQIFGADENELLFIKAELHKPGS